jgi:site-specific DNA-adenine methylase
MLNDLLSSAVVSEVIFQEAASWVDERGWICTDSVFHCDLDYIKAAYYTYILWWMGQGGMAGTQAAEERPRMSVRYTDGGRVASRFRNATRNLPAMRERIHRVEFWNQDLFKVVDKIEDREDTVIYCDPPWLDDGSAYAYSFNQKKADGGMALLGDQEQERDDFDRLEQALSRFKKARVIVRIGNHERLSALFTTGWSRMAIERTNHLGSQSKRDEKAGNKKQELLICNQEFIEGGQIGKG